MGTLKAALLRSAAPADPSNHQATGHGTTVIVVVAIAVLLVAAVVAVNFLRSRRNR